MTQNFKKYLLCVTIGVFLTGCAKEMETTFQKTKADPKVKLFQIFDETPAIKSMFENIDQDIMNQKMNDLQNANPELQAQLYLSLGNMFYGPNAPFPEMVKSMSKGLNSFHSVYSQDPDALDATIGIAEDILRIDSQVMMDGVDSIINVITRLRNWNDANNNGIIDPDERLWSDLNGDGIKDPGEEVYYWDFFGPYQEFSDIGYDGINRLIDNLDFVHTLYDGAENMDDPAYLMQNLLQTVIDENIDVEARVAETIDYIENPKPGESIRDIEEDVADWMIADPDKKIITDYLIGQLYPMIKDPVLDDVAQPEGFADMDLPPYLQNGLGQNSIDYFRNFIRRGRWVLEEQMKILSATPAGLSIDANTPSSDKTLLTQWLVGAFNSDILKWDDLETVNIFDFQNNELLKWLGGENTAEGYSIGERLKSALKLNASETNGITPAILKSLLWDGIAYTSTNNYTTTFKGLMRSFAPYPDDPDRVENWTIQSGDGYVTRMAKFKSGDTVNKPFRAQAASRLSGKTVYPSYNGESQLESILTNMQLHILQDYYFRDTVNNVYKWALTPEDGQAFFGDPNRNIQTLLGGITQSLRNAIMLDKNGNKTGQLSALSELLYVMAASYGVVDPDRAPGELSVQNCMRSMGSPLGTSTSLETCTMGICITIPVIGANDIYRKSIHESNYVRYATQHGMPANELLQPGTFRRRESQSSVYEWHGKFSTHQGDLIGSANASGKMITTNWNMAEIAQASWEGYGPYTYRGKAPNGGMCKYENDFYSDWYYIREASFGWPEPHHGNKGPGVGDLNLSYGRYHMYETIYVPQDGQTGFVPVKDEAGNDVYVNGHRVPKYGFLRQQAGGSRHFTDGNYNIPGTHFSLGTSDANDVRNGGNRISVDCTSREEAIRKNAYWLLNQKKYLYVIPIHAAKRIGFLFINADIEIFAYNLIIANGIAGIASAKRHGDTIDHNAIWGSGVNSNLGGDRYSLDVVDEGSNTSRLDGVSFDDRDYCVLLDYRFYNSGGISWLVGLLVDMTDEIWKSLGSGPVLPAVVGDNLQVMLTMANDTYEASEILNCSVSDHNDDPSMDHFQPFFTEYYPEVNIGLLRDADKPPIPRVNGVKYPVAFDEAGTADTWALWDGDNKGKFDDFLAVLALIVGTIHEDGTVCTDWNGTAATAAQIDSGNFTYFARNGFRGELDNFILTTVALNQTKYDPDQPKTIPGVPVSYPVPLYNNHAITNILIDQNPTSGGSMEPGSRKGLLPALLNSKYANINYTEPIKKSVEAAVRGVVRSYLNSFLMSAGPANDGKLVPFMLNGERNPAIDWDVPIYRLMYFVDNVSLDQLRRSLDMIRDLSQDERFVDFFKKSIPAINSYLYVKWLEENWDSGSTDPRPSRLDAEAQGLFQLSIEDDDIDTLVSFLSDFEYGEFIDFIKDTRINDMEELYNFSFEQWGADITPGVLKEQLGNLNQNLVKYFSANLLEAAVLGVYEVKADVKLSQLRELRKDLGGIVVEEDRVVFEAGDLVYGHGKYVEFDELKDGDGDETIELEVNPVAVDGCYLVTGGDDFWGGIDPVIKSGDKYYKYIDAKKWVGDNIDDPTKVKVLFHGLKKYIDFRYGATDTFSDYCLSYRSPWFRAGMEYVPNVFNLHNYDFRMDWVMDEYNKSLIVFKQSDFEYGKPLKTYEDPIGKNNTVVMRPATVIDVLFGWNGSSNQGMSLQNEINFAKNVAIDKVFDDNEFTVPDPTTEFKEDYTATPREIVRDYRTYLMDNVLEYEYMTGAKESYYPATKTTSPNDLSDGHRHAVNNITEVIAELLSPKLRHNPTVDNPGFVIDSLFESWERFVEEADIDPLNLAKVQKAVGHLVWDETVVRTSETDPRDLAHLNKGYYTHLFSDMSDKMPSVMRQFQGLYNDLTQLGLLTFSDDGIGKYMLDVMKVDDRYDSWDLVEEFNYLINTDIFQNYTDRDTFWWQAGNLLEDLAIILLRREERGETQNSLDYFGAVQSIFR